MINEVKIVQKEEKLAIYSGIDLSLGLNRAMYCIMSKWRTYWEVLVNVMRILSIEVGMFCIVPQRKVV